MSAVVHVTGSCLWEVYVYVSDAVVYQMSVVSSADSCLCVVPVFSEAGSRARSVNSKAGRYVYVSCSP